jgi:hypothetical protein
MPNSNRSWLPLSTVEWIASLSIAALLVKTAAANFVAAIKRLGSVAKLAFDTDK